MVLKFKPKLYSKFMLKFMLKNNKRQYKQKGINTGKLNKKY